MMRPTRLAVNAALCLLTLTCVRQAVGAERLDTAQLTRVVGRTIEVPGKWCDLAHMCSLGCAHTEWECQPDVDPIRCHKASSAGEWFECSTRDAAELCRQVGIECWTRWTGTIVAGTCPTGCPNYYNGDCRHADHCVGGDSGL